MAWHNVNSVSVRSLLNRPESYLFGLMLDHTWLCSVLTSGSVFRHHFLQSWRTIGYARVWSGTWLCARQIPDPLYYLCSPDQTVLKLEMCIMKTHDCKLSVYKRKILGFFLYLKLNTRTVGARPTANNWILFGKHLSACFSFPATKCGVWWIWWWLISDSLPFSLSPE